MANIKGIGNVQAMLKSLRRKTEAAMQKGIMKTAKSIETDAKAAVPKKLGQLQSSIGIEQKPEVTYVFASAPYAAFQEFGTGDMVEIPKGYEGYAREFFVTGKGTTRAHAFLFPAFFKHRDSVMVNVELEINKILDK